MPATTLAPLKWRTITNGTKKVATTHFGTEYTVAKVEGSWFASVTTSGGSRVLLAAGATFAQARKAAITDYQVAGGR